MKIVLTNCPPEQADAMASTLVVEGLAVCVNAFPVRSTYRWKGELQQDQEVTLLMKAPASTLQRLCERLCELHPYELPEFIVLDVNEGASLAAYIHWVQSGGG